MSEDCCKGQLSMDGWWYHDLNCPEAQKDEEEDENEVTAQDISRMFKSKLM